MTNLIFNLYLDAHPERRRELIKSIEQNASTSLRLIPIIGPDFNEYIDWKWHTVVLHPTIPTFTDLFNIARIKSKQNDINIIANTDIMFFQEDIDLICANLGDNECYALTRYDMVDDIPENAKFRNRIDTQDCWCFRGPPPKISLDTYLGVRGCDNRLAYILDELGIKILNPSRSIKVYHNHLSLKRNRNLNSVVPPPYKYLSPHFLGEESRRG